MGKILRRMLSALLAASMLTSFVPAVLAEENDDSGIAASYFDFDATDYETRENAGVFNIKIIRAGSTAGGVNVAFKAADFLSEYGVDYEILGEDGEPLKKIEGIKPDASEFTYDAENSDIVIQNETQKSDAEEISEAVETEPTATEEISEEAEADTAELTAVKKKQSAGSPLRDAQAAYLNLPDDTSKEETESAIKETLENMADYFESAEGAGGIVHFDDGETEKTITIKLYDNDEPDGDKIFMASLMGTDVEEAQLAPNATTYVTVTDDEPTVTPRFELADDETVLTSEQPEGVVTIKRTDGTQYFSTIYVSTVKQTAQSGAYNEFSNETVAFVPGETEKKIKVTAYDFSSAATFGVRLEGGGDVEIGNHYVEINISGPDANEDASPSEADETVSLQSEDAGDAAAPQAEEADDTVSLMSSDIKLGSADSGEFLDIPGGWKKDVTGDGNAGKSALIYNKLYAYQYNKNKYSMLVSNDKQNLAGVKSITVNTKVANYSNKNNQKYNTYFETDSDQTFAGSLNQLKFDGNHDWREDSLSLGNTGDSAFLKFSTKPYGGGKNNPYALLKWMKYNYAYYSFNPQNSAENFTRKIYDFTQSNPDTNEVPNVYDTVFDGETTRVYNPGTVYVKNGNDTVAGFYGNNSDTITITAANVKKGFYLAGVYFASSDKDEKKMYADGKYTTKGVYYVEASNDEVTVTPNSDFIKTLKDKGVIGGLHEDSEIKIFPVFKQETVVVNIENTDRDDNDSSSKGKFDKDHLGSYIINVLEAADDGNVKKYTSRDGIDYYQINVPKYSVIRVQSQPRADRTANGIVYWRHSDDVSNVTYYQADTKRFGETADGETIASTDYSKADIVADENMSLKPVTDEQTFDLRYFPEQKIPQDYQGENGLRNAVVPTGSINGDIISGGVYRLKNVKSNLYFRNNIHYPTGLIVQDSIAEDGSDLWTIQSDGEGYYNLVNGDGRYLCVSANTNSTHFSLNPGDYTVLQDFYLKKLDDGTYAIISRARNDEKCAGGGGNYYVELQDFTGDDGQKWVLEPYDVNTGTDKDGLYSVSKPYTGMNWSFTAIPPEGYYTMWANMTGDSDHDGYIDKDESNQVQNKSATIPDEVYGNKFSGVLDQDNLSIYYYFLPMTGIGTGTKTGVVTRDTTSFYDLAAGKSGVSTEPVSGAYVDVGGFVGMTDGNGEYSIDCKGFPSYGNVSTTITVDGAAYSTVSKLQRHTDLVIPALSKFTAKETAATYEKASYVSGKSIVVTDDKLHLTATASSDSALRASNARFFIYDENGSEKYACEGRSGYATKGVTNGNEFTAELIFNPKEDMATGYKVYVQFEDQGGEWTNPIDLGYAFAAEMTLDKFIFPLIGSSSLENFYESDFVVDLIGNPLGDMSLGSISDFNYSSSEYTPSNIDKNKADKYTWLRQYMSYGWSKEFSKSKDSGKKDDKDKNEEIKEDLEKIDSGEATDMKEPSEASKYSTKGKFSWSITPAVGFNLTISTRADNKNYFEDLIFYVKADFDVNASNTISLPLGFSIIISAELDGDVIGIYHMYVDYDDSYETEGAVEFTSEDFGIFKKYENGSRIRREGYIFLNPEIVIELGVSWQIVKVEGSAHFAFDMDFQFTEADVYDYGDMTFKLNLAVKLLGFKVYAKNYADTTVKLFNTKGTDKHIDFDYDSAATAALMSVKEAFADTEDDDLILDQPVTRDYLKHRSGWLGDKGNVSLMSIDASKGTVENTLMDGVNTNPYVRIEEFDDDKLLMVFIDDDTERSDVNKRALYYSVYDGAAWSEPVLVDDDGTPDDYPMLYNMGNGEIFVAWSSADRALADGETVEDALKAMNIKTAFFDTQTLTMGEVTQVTKTTEEDYAADVLPNAAYDEDSGKLLLYYTKTEYDDLEKVSDISDAYSVNAYMFYDTNTGKWSGADDYTDDELGNMTDAEKEKYKKNWYGQRFLDLRLDKTSSTLPRVADSGAISYNGLGLFTWTIDWDNDLDTTDDRDVFMQIYNFSENSFTHIIRVTPETGSYISPKFDRSNNATYLFYGAKDEDSDHGEIRYLNVSNLIKNGNYTLYEGDGGGEYYVFEYKHEAREIEDSDGTIIEIPEETIIVSPDTAAVCDNPTDYDVNVTGDGKISLFWTEAEDDTRQIAVSQYNGTDYDDNEDADDETDEETDSDDSGAAYWSEPIVLTNGDTGTYYSDIGAAVAGDDIIVVSAKGDYDDESAGALVWNKHTPFGKLKTSELSMDEEYPQPNGAISLTATVKNEGSATVYATEEDPVTVTFAMNGESIGTARITSPVAGGSSVDVSCGAQLPEDISDIEFKAYIEENEAVGAKLEYSAVIELDDSQIDNYKASGYEDGKTVYSGVLKNTGNKAMSDIEFTVKAGETEAGTLTVDTLEANETQNIEITLDIPDSEYEINEYGTGIAQIELEAVADKETVAEYSGEATKTFDADYIAQTDKVTAVTFENNGGYELTSGDKADIQPAIAGADEGALTVKWIDASDGNVAYINYDNLVCADEAGTATITGIVVPSEERIVFDSYGNSEKEDWQNLIPEDKLITVTAKVTVSAAEEPTPTPTHKRSGGGSSSSAKATPTPAPTAEPEETTEPQETAELSGGGYVNPFTDVFESDWFYDSVRYVYENNMFAGVEADKFDPQGNLTRAMLVTVLYRSEGEPEVTESSGFEDVETDSWYENAVAWAENNGIVMGYSDTEFAPNDNITREQIAAIMFRFAQYKGTAPEGVWAIRLDYADLADISDWASEAVMYCKLKGIMLGNDNNEFKPLNNATRAEAAAIMQRFTEDLKTINE